MFKVDISEGLRDPQVHDHVLHARETRNRQREGSESGIVGCKRRNVYHGLLWNRPRSDIHPIIGGHAPNIQRPRSLVIVYPGDVLCGRERIASGDGQSRSAWEKKGDTYRTIESWFVLEPVHGVAPGAGLVTTGVYDHQHSSESGLHLLG